MPKFSQKPTQKQGSIPCELCGAYMEMVRESFEPRGTYYHPMDAWWMSMNPPIIDGRKPCPNAGKKIRLNADWRKIGNGLGN